jgi:hypothetical protein
VINGTPMPPIVMTAILFFFLGESGEPD